MPGFETRRQKGASGMRHGLRVRSVSARARMTLLGVLVLAICCCAMLFPAPASAAVYRAIHDGARNQWDNANGYCGECSLQVAGIEMGFWISQDQARKLAGGEALLGAGENYDTMLNKLHLQHIDYPEILGTLADRQNFITWMRDGMVAGDPVIFGVKIHGSWGGDPYYDHIICAYYANGAVSGYNGADTLGYSDNYGSESSYTFNQWRDGWQYSGQIYYLPENGVQQFGTRITGMQGDNETVPISLSVPLKTEPNVTLGKSPLRMNATVNMSGLTVGTTYYLLRWDATSSTIASVPFTNLLASATAANIEYQFTAGSSSASRAVSFMSNGITIFRLVHGKSSGAVPPTVTGFTPAAGAPGTSVTITGTRFTGATAVTFNGTAAATFSVVSDTQLRATVPSGATTGRIAVTNPGGTGSGATSFTVTAPPRLLDEGFEDGDLVGWTISGDGAAVTAAAQAGVYAARMKRATSMTRSVNVFARGTVTLSFWVKTQRFASGENIYAQTSTNGTTWTTCYAGRPTSYTSKSFTIATGGASILYVRFRVNARSSSAYGYVDTISVQ
jgi:hypothetical protein